MRDPLFISKTSQLTDSEAAHIQTVLEQYALDHGTACATLSKNQSGWCANITKGLRLDWDHIWGREKSFLYKQRLRDSTINAT